MLSANDLHWKIFSFIYLHSGRLWQTKKKPIQYEEKKMVQNLTQKYWEINNDLKYR